MACLSFVYAYHRGLGRNDTDSQEVDKMDTRNMERYALMTKQQTTYPRGKLCEDDEGELQMRLGIQDKTVIIDFGKPVKWFGMAKKDTINLANALLEKANEL